MKKVVMFLLASVMIFSATACSLVKTENSAANSSEKADVKIENSSYNKKAEPKKALKEIYKNVEREYGLVDADDDVMSDVMGFDMENVEEYYVRYMETDFGASDVFIIKAVEGMENEVRSDLKNWQESRVRAFLNYDIYNSTEISQNALIFQRGEYIIMLALEDNESAREIIEKYIPEEYNLD